MLASGAGILEITRMLMRKNRVLVAKNAKSVRSGDPLEAFKRQTKGEMGKYQVRGEIWKSLRKLVFLAAGLALFYFMRECWLAWDIFQ